MAVVLSVVAIPAHGQTELLAIEFNQDDQAGFDLWPSGFSGTSVTANFSNDPVATSGTTTVTLTSNTGFGVPANRGSLSDGNPPGFTYARLYQDLLIAFTPPGFLTIDVSGLIPSTEYRFTLYAWDPGASDASDTVWTVTGGSGSQRAADDHLAAGGDMGWGTGGRDHRRRDRTGAAKGRSESVTDSAYGMDRLTARGAR